MDARLASPHGAALCARRKITVEPVFGDIKTNRGYRRFTPGAASTRSPARLTQTS
jgi:Transposase DDE domain